MTAYLPLLALTLCVEVPLLLWLLADDPAGRRRMLADGPLLNLVSHPLAYLAVTSGMLTFAWTEAAVVVFEALGFRLVTRLAWGRALRLSAAANGATILLSVLAAW